MKRGLLVVLCLMLSAAQFGCAGNRLSQAAIDGNLPEIEAEIRAGEAVNEIDKWGWTPLLWSVYYGNVPVARYLLASGADPNIRTQRDYGSYPAGTTALILAASYGHADAVEALLKNSADPSVVDPKGKRAIDYAEEFQFERCVALLKGSR